MRQEGNHLIAEQGFSLRRKGTNDVFGRDIYLGYSHYIDGVLQDPPHLDVAEDFEEIIPDDEITAEEALQIITGTQEA